MEKYKEGIKWVGDFLAPGCLRTSVIILGIITSILFACNDNGKIDPGVKPSPVPVPIDTIKTPDGKDSVIYESERLSIAQPAYATVNMGNNAEANYYILRAYLDSLPDWGTVYLPQGTFTFNKILEFKKPVRIFGQGKGTKLVGPGLIVKPGAWGFIKDLQLHNSGGTNGITISGITHLENVDVYRFPGDGVHITADIHIDGANASQSTFRNVEVIECGGNGFFMRGGDSNGMTFYSCSARDNKGIGFYDHSFLGNSFFGCMGHANAKGHYKSDDPNSRSVFVGCYSENQGVKNVIGGAGRVLGGIHPDGWELLTPWAKVDFQ